MKSVNCYTKNQLTHVQQTHQCFSVSEVLSRVCEVLARVSEVLARVCEVLSRVKTGL